MSFEDELTNLINRYSKENDSNTPDFILAKYLCGCLFTFNEATNKRTEWSKPENTVQYRGSVTDLATDIAFILNDFPQEVPKFYSQLKDKLKV